MLYSDVPINFIESILRYQGSEYGNFYYSTVMMVIEVNKGCKLQKKNLNAYISTFYRN
jgi:hypothetical protein